jgi:putative flippase GtrA
MIRPPLENAWNRLQRMTLVGAYCRYVRQHFRQLFRFVLVGGSIAVFNLLTFYLFREIAGLGDRMAVNGMYVSAVLLHFFSHRHFTFEANSGAIHGQGGRYIVMLIWNYLLYQLLVGLAPTVNVSAYAAVVASGLLTVVSNFLLMNHLIFRRTDLTTDARAADAQKSDLA